jgi:multiple sugar transport system substrate-binding protein
VLARRVGSVRLTSLALGGMALLVAGALASCSSSGDHGGSGSVRGQTITVAMHYPSPPKNMLAKFTRQTGIKVKWVQVGFSDLQTKISTAASSNSYFADATDVDWSEVGEYAQTHWFTPLNKYFNVTELKNDVPQLSTFIADGQLVGVPFDASFVVTTINKKDFAHAGIKSMPTTIDEFDSDMKKLQAKGMQHPLNLYLAATPGLSQCWFQLTEAFGGHTVDQNFKPQFTSPDSAGYRALQWIVDQYKTGVVPPGNINLIDYTSFNTQMAQNRTAATMCDYSGNVASVYNVAKSSKVVNQIQYIQTPGTNGPGPVMANADGIGIPAAAHNKAAAAKFLQWFTTSKNQAIWAGLNGENQLIPAFPLPMRVSSLKLLEKTPGAQSAGISDMTRLLSASKPILASKAPAGYVSFYNTTTTAIHDAAAGTNSVEESIRTIAAAAEKLSSGS